VNVSEYSAETTPPRAGCRHIRLDVRSTALRTVLWVCMSAVKCERERMKKESSLGSAKYGERITPENEISCCKPRRHNHQQ